MKKLPTDEAEILPAASSMGRNEDFPWDEFDSVSYQKHNYIGLRLDDRKLLELVRDYFGSIAPDGTLDGVEVGAGSNIYPALALLPWCKKITMVEYSARNVAWLDNEVRSYSPTWDPFWDLLCDQPGYRAVLDPRVALASRACVSKGSIFQLPTARWDIGTMFFVAESISRRRSEFDAAVGRFLGALRPGAPFAAAFMEGSEGYTVGTCDFPAVAVDAADVRACIEDRADELHVDRVGIIGDDVLREGYTGMILARGLTRSS
jgi:hypothetical protein